jgi:Pentatricopeptide repeat domain
MLKQTSSIHLHKAPHKGRSTLPQLKGQRNVQAAWELFKRMEGAGVKATVATYNAVLRAAARLPGGSDQLKVLYADMAAAGLRPDTYTCASVFLGAAEAAVRDGTWLLEVQLGPSSLGVRYDQALCRPVALPHWV